MAEEDGQESATDLRSRLSRASNLAADALARAVIAEEGLTHVTLEDAKGMDPEKVEGRLRDLNAERVSAADTALDALLKEKGMTREEFDALGTQGGGGAPPGNPNRAAIENARGAAAGQPKAKAPIDLSGIEDDGNAQMTAYFREQESRKS